MAGRPATPKHLKLVTGTTRSHKRGKSAKPTTVEPTAPRSGGVALPYLSPRAVECWATVAPMLDRMGVLTTADEMALGELCEAFADVTEARSSLANPVEVRVGDGEFMSVAEAGAVTYTTRGKEGWMIRARPEVAIIEAASRRFHALLAQFGMTPAARSKINLAPSEKADTVDAYFGT